jgi:ribosome-associated protein
VTSIKDWAITAARAAADKKAVDVVVLDVAPLLVVTDYFVICSGASAIQVRAIADEIEDRLRVEVGIKPIGREGESEGKWVLLDFGDLVAHIFQPAERDFYRLENLWGDAAKIDLPAEARGERAPAAEVAE